MNNEKLPKNVSLIPKLSRVYLPWQYKDGYDTVNMGFIIDSRSNKNTNNKVILFLHNMNIQ